MAQQLTHRNQTNLSASPPNTTTLSVTTEQPKVFWVGLIIYLISFFIPATGSPTMHGPAFGYFCAFYSLWTALSELMSRLHGSYTIMGLTENLALFGSGTINILFLVAVYLILSTRSRPIMLFFLKAFILVLFPLCWVVFHYEKMYPFWGYFLWTGGMLLVLFKSKPQASHAPAAGICSRR